MRVLALGTNRMCFERLHNLGHDIVLLVPKGRARPEDTTGPYRHLVVLDDRTPPEEWIEVARAFHRATPFDTVVAYNEHTYPQVDKIATSLDINTVVDVELYRRVRDKSATRQLLDAHGIPSCRYVVARGANDIRAAVDAVGRPCIVKPIDGEGSEGVVKVDQPGDLDCALALLGAGRVTAGVLVEEFLPGTEFSVEAISVGRTHHIVAITRKYVDPRTFVEHGHVVPAPLDADERFALEAYVCQVLDALGFHDCPSHTEVVLTENGPRLIETHNRIGGDSILDLARLATSVDLYDLTVAQSIGAAVAVPESIVAARSAAVWFAAPSNPGEHTLTEVRHLADARRSPGVEGVKVLRPIGSPQVDVRRSGDRSAFAIAIGTTADDAVAKARAATRLLEFVYTRPPSDPAEGTSADR